MTLLRIFGVMNQISSIHAALREAPRRILSRHSDCLRGGSSKNWVKEKNYTIINAIFELKYSNKTNGRFVVTCFWQKVKTHLPILHEMVQPCMSQRSKIKNRKEQRKGNSMSPSFFSKKGVVC